MKTTTQTIADRVEELIAVIGKPNRRTDIEGRSILHWYGDEAGQICVDENQTLFSVYGTGIEARTDCVKLEDPDYAALNRKGMWMVKFYGTK